MNNTHQSEAGKAKSQSADREIIYPDGEHPCLSSCYYARSSRSTCRCVCGGRFHGRGRSELLAKLIERLKAGNSLDTKQNSY